jgi:hypothetical protein
MNTELFATEDRNPAATRMTKAEREELRKVVRSRVKVARGDAEARASVLLADFERQIAARYPDNHPAWADLTAHARDAVKKADDQIAELCRRMGIPPEFRPEIRVTWFSRGENALRERREELRRVAKAEAAAMVKSAKTEIDRAESVLLTELAIGGLESDQARAFFERLPSPDQLMPALALERIEGLVNPNPRLGYSLMGEAP